MIYVGTTGTNPPQKVPLSQWRAAHTGFTFHEQPVLLPVEPLDPSPPGASSTIENIPDAPAYAQARGQSQAQRPGPPTPSLTNTVARTAVKPDPLSQLRIGEDFYPEASKRAHEEGRCVVLITVAADGRITEETLQVSSGFPRLDEACLKAFHGKHMLPATENGKPIETSLAIPLDWKITN